jgi:hypothetical protein
LTATASLAFANFFPTRPSTLLSRPRGSATAAPPRVRPVVSTRCRIGYADLDAHAAAVPFTVSMAAIQRLRVEVGQLQLGDLLHLLHADLADLVLVGLARCPWAIPAPA